MMYISGMGHVSPLASGNHLPNQAVLPTGPVYSCIEPDYQDFINGRLLRRMARIIKMSVAASTMAMADAQIQQLDAIITGTSLGCSEDTHEFLASLITDNETLLSPTAFIKSTHNTIGGQIALMGNYNCYNMTYAHRSFSFESALLDGMLQLHEGANNVLVGGIDEITEVTTKLLQRLGCIEGETNPQAPKGGEGAVFLLLSNTVGPNNYAVLNNVSVSCKMDAERATVEFVNNQAIDLVLIGANSMAEYTEKYASSLQMALPNTAIAYYKYLCGEYHTSASLATLLAALMIKSNQVPNDAVLSGVVPQVLKNVLIYNRSEKGGHSFIHLSKC